MDKLIITVCPAGSGGFPGAPDMADARAQAAAVIEAYNAGASVAHIHGAMDPRTGSREPDLGHWAEMTGLIRAQSDLIVQFGRAVMKPDVRGRLIAVGAEMASFLLGHHDILTPAGPLNALCPLDEIETSARHHLEAGVMPELEVWHAGNLWNMEQLSARGLITRPFYTTLFFGWPGGHWSPPTAQEVVGRVALLPEGTVWGVSARGPRQVALQALAIAEGGHVRTGWEDGADLHPGQPARSSAALVERIVRLARDMGREVASPQEAREILGLPRRPVPTRS